MIVYRVPAGEPGAGTGIVHRIVGGSAEAGYVVKRDNKTGIDPWYPRIDDVAGEVRLKVPRAGSVLIFARTPLGLALVFALATMIALVVPSRSDGSTAPWRPSCPASRPTGGRVPP